MVDLSTLGRFLADTRSTRARVDGRLVAPGELVEGADGRAVRVEHLGDDAWAEARGFRLHPWRALWIGEVDPAELTDLEVHSTPEPARGVVPADAWRAWSP